MLTAKGEAKRFREIWYPDRLLKPSGYQISRKHSRNHLVPGPLFEAIRVPDFTKPFPKPFPKPSGTRTAV